MGSPQGARKSNCPFWRAAATMAWAVLSSWLASTEETICASLTVKPSFWVASRGKPATDASASTPRSANTEAAYSALVRRRTRAGSSGLSDAMPPPVPPPPPPATALPPTALPPRPAPPRPPCCLPPQPPRPAPAKIKASAMQRRSETIVAAPKRRPNRGTFVGCVHGEAVSIIRRHEGVRTARIDAKRGLRSSSAPG